jgi:hypothetical protein
MSDTEQLIRSSPFSRLDLGERLFYPLPIPLALLIGSRFRLGIGQRVECQWTRAPRLRQVNAGASELYSSGIPALRSPAK